MNAASHLSARIPHEGDAPQRRDTPASPARILESGHTAWRIEHADRVGFLVDGEQYYGAVARAFLHARHSIFLLGWDVNSGIRLLRGNDEDELPSALGERLAALLERRRELRVRVLDWDYPVFFAQERESRLRTLTCWPSNERFELRYDDAHPPGASQHQKLVVVDDSIAFCGGMDIGLGRWDTSRHLARDQRRDDPGFGRYVPAHDVMMIADGAVARAAGELARERWRRATGESVAGPFEPDHDGWPNRAPVDARDVDVGISRTSAAFGERPAVCEVEALHRAAIAAARRWIYVENQYLTSEVVVRALTERLQDPDGPEIVIVLPQNNFGWFEARTIQVLHFRCIRRLRAADTHGRLRVCYPRIPDLGDEQVNLHSKVLVVDDRFAKIGSSNLTNRSMRLDSECDWSLEADGRPHVSAAIATLRNRLLAEHLCMEEADVAARLEETGSLCALVDARDRGVRCLCRIEPQAEDAVDLGDGAIIDPKGPLTPELVIETFAQPDVRRRARPRLLRLVLVIVLLAGLAAVWRWTPLREWIRPEVLAGIGFQLRESPLAPLGVVAAYVVGAFVVAPVLVLVLATAALFGPWHAVAYSLAGSLASAWLMYEIGRRTGHRTVESLTGRQYRRIAEGLRDRGITTMIVLRMLPIAPFTIVNLVLGVSGIGRREFLIGTAIGMLPGIVALSVFQSQLLDAVRSPDAASLVRLGVVCAVLVGAIAWLHGRLRVRRREDQSASSRSRSRFTSTSATSG